MKVGLLVTSFNRPEHLKNCLDSLSKCDVLNDCLKLIVDDASTKMSELDIAGYAEGWASKRMITNGGIKKSLLFGYEYMFEWNGCDIVINLDCDSIVKPNFITRLLELHKLNLNNIITGFHCTTKNANGTDRHPIIKQSKNHCFKSSVGGINMLVTKSIYENYLLESLNKPVGNWDADVCKKMYMNGKPVVCAVPSLVQHTGIESTMGHHEQPDLADDFDDRLQLPSVTVIGIDCVNIERLLTAIKATTANIDFGDVKILSHLNHPSVTHKIKHLTSKQEYSKFCIQDLFRYIQTEHCLVVQYDGYVNNHKAWNPENLKYDYIGAPWWYNDKMNVGNGGFSLRSRKLMKHVSEMGITECHPEDHQICRTYRYILEQEGFKFAPEEIAERFSYEGHRRTDKLNGQFGFHGFKAKEVSKPKTYIINQFQGLGDILFCVPLVRELMKQGHYVIWPIINSYMSISRHFPDIHFVPHGLMAINFNNASKYDVLGATVLPLRYAASILQMPDMAAKYPYMNMETSKWRELTWKRDKDRERELCEITGAKGIYNLICEEFTTNGGSQIKIEPMEGVANVYMKSIHGFTMLDWACIIEHATYIHAVSSATLYMFELLELKAKEINLYKRTPDRDLSAVSFLFTKKYIQHI